MFRPQERLRPAFLRENAEIAFGAGGWEMLFLSRYDLWSSRPGRSVEEAAVDAALRREELSVVDAVLELDPPLALQ